VDSGLAVVVIVVSIVGIVAAIAAYIGSGKLYEQVGKGAFALDRDPERTGGHPPDSPAARAEAEAEIRQLVEAKSARRVARGEQPLDVEAEIAKLTDQGTGNWQLATGDSALREEVRQLVQARNERRIARGEEPLDVDAEVDRQLRELGA
jgi:hypothetical protein